MRSPQKINRRFFLSRTWTAFLSFLFTWFFFPKKSLAKDKDYFTGTEYVGKNRTEKFKHFYINYWKPFLRIQPKNWRLRVDGLCSTPQIFDIKQIYSFSKDSQDSRMKCVECWSARAEWAGFRFQQLEKICPPLPNAVGVLFHCEDEYQEYLTLEELRHPRTLIATHMNGKPLSDEHGFPIRVIIPFKYGYKNPKAIHKMEYVSNLTYGTWSRIGSYSTDGTILPGYDHPLELRKKRHRISGGEITDY